MSLVRPVILALTFAISTLPALAETDKAAQEAQYRKAVSTFITLQGFPCGAVLTVAQREEPNAFDVVCSTNEDGSGVELAYFFQLINGGAVVKPQTN